MPTSLGWLYLFGGTVLFFFWAYGIVSFVLDVKNKFVPAGKRLVAERRRRTDRAEAETERDDPEKQSY